MPSGRNQRKTIVNSWVRCLENSEMAKNTILVIINPVFVIIFVFIREGTGGGLDCRSGYFKKYDTLVPHVTPSKRKEGLGFSLKEE